MQIDKNSATTGFSFDVYIDTEEIIKNFAATDYMYKGRV